MYVYRSFGIGGRFSFLPERNEEFMKFAEETKKSLEETKREQEEVSKEKTEEERNFWLDAKYSDVSSDSDR